METVVGAQESGKRKKQEKPIVSKKKAVDICNTHRQKAHLPRFMQPGAAFS
jgi:hypothetical protein